MSVFILIPVGLNYDPQGNMNTAKGRLAYTIYRTQQTLRIPLMFLNILAMISDILWG